MCLKDNILELETKLLKSEVRKCADAIEELLTDDFTEFCSSGKVYNYKKGDIFQNENDNSEDFGMIIDFNISKLSESCILATYKLIKSNELNEDKKYSIRSSIWKYIDGNWKMFFHQGTILK